MAKASDLLKSGRPEVISFTLEADDFEAMSRIAARMQVQSGVDIAQPGAFTIRNHSFKSEKPGAFVIRNHNFSVGKPGAYTIRNYRFERG